VKRPRPILILDAAVPEITARRRMNSRMVPISVAPLRARWKALAEVGKIQRAVGTFHGTHVGFAGG